MRKRGAAGVKREIRETLRAHGWLAPDELVDHLYEEYHAPDSYPYTDEDIWQQTRKKAMFYTEHRRMWRSPGEWAPGWEPPE